MTLFGNSAGEGQDIGSLMLDDIFGKCVGQDAEWAQVRSDGFTWWPYQQAQSVTAYPWARDGASGSVIHIATEVRRDVAVTPEALEAVAALNAELSQSALVLREDGSLVLACRVFLHESTLSWANFWVRCLTVEQLVAARELDARLDGIGVAAISGHPTSGLRPSPDELFGIREDYLIPAASGVRVGLGDLVPFLAAVSQYALPYTLSSADNGGLSFNWRPSPRSASPVVRVDVRLHKSSAGFGWLVRSHLPVAGDASARARWCNERNIALLDGPATSELTVVGGWGTDPDGSCCLTTWMSPHFIRDELLGATELVGNLLRYHQSAVIAALSAAPEAVASSTLTAKELAVGLHSVISAFASALEFPEDMEWSVGALDDGAVVILSGGSSSGVPFTAMRYGSPAADEPGKAPHSFGLRLAVPLGYNRPELSVLYSALLSITGSDSRPGETDGFPSDWYAQGLSAAMQSEGLVSRAEDGSYAFSIGHVMARFQVDRVKFGPNPVESALWRYDPSCMRISGVLPDPDLEIFVVDGDVIGTWNQYPEGLAYEVVVPPIPAVWPGSYFLEETLSWVARHVIRHVQAAVQGHGHG